MSKASIFLGMMIILYSCGGDAALSYDIILANAKIINVVEGTVIEDQWIGIYNDTVVGIGSMKDFPNLKSGEVLDVKGDFVMPGLWDNHVHFRGGDSLIEENKNLLPLFLAFGITTVRDAGGDISTSVLNWRKEVLQGTLDGPNIFTSGPKLDGSKPAWAGSLSVTNINDLNKALDSLAALEVDYVKLYDGNLTAEMFYNIIKASEERGWKTAGHMPMSANILTAAAIGLDGSEHMHYLVKACSPKEDSLTAANKGYAMLPDIIASYDASLAAKIFESISKEGMSVTPTLNVTKTLAEILETDHYRDTLLAYIGKGIQDTYKGRIAGAKRAKERGNTLYADLFEIGKKMIIPMTESGVSIMAGSDCGPFNSFVYPGASLHEELILLVDAGLTPQQALATSMVNGPKFFDLEQKYGSVDIGKLGDFIVLKNNPLEDIRHLTTLQTVVCRGKIYDQPRLRDMMDKVKEYNRSKN